MNHWKSKFQIWVLHAGSQSFFGPPIRLSHKLIVQRAVVFFRNANGLASKISKGNRHRHQNTNAEQCFRLFVAIAADQILQPHINAVTPRYAATPMFGWWVVVTASCLLFVQRLAAAAHCKHWWTSKASRVLWLRLGLPQRDRPLLQMIGMFQKSFLCSFASHSFLRHLRLNLSCINK